jgi:pyruvate/2-oxoglutarate dehydrogenase complex dihydrolipoamide dehydrogenase (E3) component
MAELLKPDLCVIGGGSGGLAVAMAAAAQGVIVALVEQGELGGRRRFTDLPVLTLSGMAQRVFVPPFGQVQSEIEAAREDMARNTSKERLTGFGVRVIEGTARFADRRTVTVGAEFQIRARRFVIATGSRPAPPPLPGLDAVPYLTEESVFGLRECPRHLIVIGADATGLEFADTFRRFGAEVTVLDGAEPLAGEDAECAAVLLNELDRRGIVVRGGVRLDGVTQAGANVQIAVVGPGGTETVEGSHLLVAGPRRANLDGLGLEDAGIAHEHDGIIVGRGLKCSNRRVYAIGSAALLRRRRRQPSPASAARSSHIAVHHAELVVRRILSYWPARLLEASLPRVVRTEPELAHVGLTEGEARRRGAICVLRWPYRENDRARREQRTDGHIKILTSRSGRVLGATVVGPEAGELIAVWALAVAQGLSIRAMACLALPQASFAEIGKRAAGTYLVPSPTSSRAGHVLAWLRRFG